MSPFASFDVLVLSLFLKLSRANPIQYLDLSSPCRCRWIYISIMISFQLTATRGANSVVADALFTEETKMELPLLLRVSSFCLHAFWSTDSVQIPCTAKFVVTTYASTCFVSALHTRVSISIAQHKPDDQKRVPRTHI